MAGAHPQSFWFRRSAVWPRIRIPNSFPGDADAADPGTTLWESLWVRASAEKATVSGLYWVRAERVRRWDQRSCRKLSMPWPCRWMKCWDFIFCAVSRPWTIGSRGRIWCDFHFPQLPLADRKAKVEAGSQVDVSSTYIWKSLFFMITTVSQDNEPGREETTTVRVKPISPSYWTISLWALIRQESCLSIYQNSTFKWRVLFMMLTPVLDIVRHIDMYI